MSKLVILLGVVGVLSFDDNLRSAEFSNVQQGVDAELYAGKTRSLHFDAIILTVTRQLLMI